MRRRPLIVELRIKLCIQLLQCRDFVLQCGQLLLRSRPLFLELRIKLCIQLRLRLVRADTCRRGRLQLCTCLFQLRLSRLAFLAQLLGALLPRRRLLLRFLRYCFFLISWSIAYQ